MFAQLQREGYRVTFQVCCCLLLTVPVRAARCCRFCVCLCVLLARWGPEELPPLFFFLGVLLLWCCVSQRIPVTAESILEPTEFDAIVRCVAGGLVVVVDLPCRVFSLLSNCIACFHILAIGCFLRRVVPRFVVC